MIYLGADHGGFILKEKIKTWLAEWGQEYQDLGNMLLDPGDDETTYAQIVAQKVISDPGAKGILLCKSGGGMAIMANRFKGIRAVDCTTVEAAMHAREHNDSNVLTLAAEWLSENQAKEILQVWLNTPFSNKERYQRRIDMEDA
jgi:ribose 5-phosphate isomerase B